MKKSILIVICFLTLGTVIGQTTPAIAYGDNKEAGNYKEINGIKMYYEIYGTGKPLVLLHGNGGSIKGHGHRIEYFKKYFQVIAIDSRGHGKSVDPSNKQLTYTQMAEDVSTLLDSLKIDNAYVWGQSDGGILGLLLAINHPNKVSKLATFGANLYPGKKAIYNEIDQLVTDTLKATKNPHTKNLYNLLQYQPNITKKDLHKIKCPVLVMSGDRDAIRLEHSIEIFDNIENSNFFVMPGATHFGSYEKPDLFNMILLSFFNDPFKKTTTYERFTGK
ncbi:alpha/beta hydrolase [Flavobacterium sp. MC2016-06]|jgi:pimeloyl-ACP methyl ester carboxylesterase|uniref:alpha/beta fold hydrolase n=1 Tax=Flavobacterium sp. MC2016-06 TaxID=2676308 RepID=UPI0012BAA128|nr:alpha/beta hydrolase [Flavobacterium sp. MC2016-06]MBU3861092.1 alpha/beta hydrolase [Flavobacterium sp. MC2016-06]